MYGIFSEATTKRIRENIMKSEVDLMTTEEVILRLQGIKWNYYADQEEALDIAIEAVKLKPKKGIWELWTDDRKDYVKCSCCGYGEEGELKLGEESMYCPYCGAFMGAIRWKDMSGMMLTLAV